LAVHYGTHGVPCGKETAVAIKAQVSFRRIQIPVRVNVMTSETKGGTRFRNLHSECGSPINEQKVCRVCNMDLEPDDLVSGVEVTKGNFVTFTDEEKESVSAVKSPVIKIDKFVSAPDPMWVVQEYWLPAENPRLDVYAETYATFCDALERLGLVGLGKAALWGKERPVTVSATTRVLTMQLLHTQAEFNEAPLPVVFPVKETELEWLLSIMEEHKGQVEESDVEVESDRLLKELVASKMTGTEFVVPEPVSPEPPTTNLLETLREMQPKRRPRKRVAA
jgi:DNA end-binding protein Ku